MNNIPTPRCSHFDICSGCEILLDQKPLIWQAVTSFFEKFLIKPKLHIGPPLGWRLKAKLAVRNSPQGIIMGLFKKGTHEAVPIPCCLVHHPSINRGSLELLEALHAEKISAYDEKSRNGLLRYVQFFAHPVSGKLQLTLVLNTSSLPPSIEKLCKRLQSELWHSIWVNFHPEANNRVLGSGWERLSGEAWFSLPFLGENIPFHPGAFSQANIQVFEKLVERIRSWILPADQVVELFAGVGIIGSSLLSFCKKVVLVENNPFAALSFQERYPISAPCEYLLQDAAEFSGFASFDTILVDPPRKGLGPKLLKRLAEAGSSRLIYVSCGFESFRLDSEALIASGWRLQKTEAFLLFPGTNHIETVTLFCKT